MLTHSFTTKQVSDCFSRRLLSISFTHHHLSPELNAGGSCAGDDSGNCKSGTTCDTGDVCSEYIISTMEHTVPTELRICVKVEVAVLGSRP